MHKEYPFNATRTAMVWIKKKKKKLPIPAQGCTNLLLWKNINRVKYPHEMLPRPGRTPVPTR